MKFSFSDSLALHRFSDYLIDSLQAEGYLNLESNLQIKPDNRFFLQVDAGTQFKWIQLGKGNLEPWMESSLDGGAIIAGESPFRIEAVQHLMGQILETGQNNGYPFMAVKLDSIELDNGQLRASLYMEKGPLITFDTLRITGSSKIQPIYLARKTGIIPGNPFSQKKVNKLREVLKNSVPYLALSGSPEMSFQNEEATIYLPVEDRKMNAIDGIIGFLPNEIEANKWLVTGQFDLQLYNVSGKGRDYQLNWQRLTQYSQNLRVAAREPYVLGSQLDLGAAFSLLKEDTTFLNRDFSLRLGYQVTANTYIDFFSKWQAGDLLEVGRYENATELPEVGDFRYNSYGADFSFTDVDDPIVPKSGWRSKLTLGIGNKTLRENTGIDPALYAGIERESLQYYIRGAVDYYYRLDKNFSSRVSLQAGELNNSNLLLNDLYRLGGLQSIRGFNENFFYSSRYAYMNLEPRYYFGNYSYFLLFTDLGMLEDAVRKRERDWPFSFGAGLSLETAGGMFNFVYALGKSAGQPLGFNYSRIHFGFTGRF
ncbi:BamA/TamA family outer membrane protein [Cyclobacterium lianum]|uniref:BamA/TamA family outer membrane protein n=1 Tax=Cyclobacterium lianum TaxID=388280 RepID=UPI001FEADA09|nr:BamA/TamA family outer membrane protein [Cyclobacterium lianum]